MSPSKLSKALLWVCASCIGMFALGQSNDFSSEDESNVAEQSVALVRETATEGANVRFTNVGETNEDLDEFSAYSDWTNAQINDELNQIHMLSPHERRGLLLEVSRRIERFGHFEVDAHEQRFGHVVRNDKSDGQDETSQEPRLEEFVIAHKEESDDDVESVRVKEVRKQRQPVRRVSSGRAYTSQ